MTNSVPMQAGADERPRPRRDAKDASSRDATRICFLSSMHPPRDKRVFDKEAVTLASQGFDVTHLCPGREDEAGVEKGVRIVTYPRRNGIRGRIGQLYQLYRDAARIDADVYHCNEVDSWGVGALLKILRGKGCIFDVHEDYPSTFAHGRFPRWMHPLVEALVRGAFLALSPATDRFVLAKETVSADFRVADSRKLLVRNFAHRSGFVSSPERAPADSGGWLRLVHLGLFGKVRGWPQLLEAMMTMRHRKVSLDVIGEFNDGTRSEFEDRVRELGLADRVTIHDWMPFEQAFQRLREADVGLIAFQPGIRNHVYAMPHKMFDYMAAELAVICPDFAVEVAPIVAKEECGLLIDPSDPSDIAEKLDTLAVSPETVREMGRRGREAVARTYNWESEAEALVEMYRTWETRR
jgi:glycosyltransferase involved in cell wall biosynthesis